MAENYDWDMEIDADEISAESGSSEKKDFVVLPDGNYKFTITKVEHTTYQPKEGKTTGITAPCKQIKLGIVIHGGAAGNSWADENLFCWKTTLFKALLVLKSIGAIPEHGFKGAPPIDQLKGGEGVCRIKTETYAKRDGSGEGTKNVIDRFYVPSEAAKVQLTETEEEPF